MALKSKKDEELLFPIDVDETTDEQISFDDLEFEAEFLTDEELEELKPQKYYTITGKEQWYEPEWEKFSISELDVGTEMTGRPEVTIFENKDKSYNAMRLRLLDDGEICDCYFNYPKRNYPYVKNINKEYNFYRTCFDFIYSILKFRDERNVVNKDGEEINNFKQVNLENFAKYVDKMTRVGVKVTEGNPDSEYNSWIIYMME